MTSDSPRFVDNFGSSAVKVFTYRGVECHVRSMHRQFMSTHNRNAHNGYMTGPFTVTSYDEADAVAEAHGGFTFACMNDDGTVTLGFDTLHFHDDEHTQNPEYVEQAIKDAVDNLYAAGVVEEAPDGQG